MLTAEGILEAHSSGGLRLGLPADLGGTGSRGASQQRALEQHCRLPLLAPAAPGLLAERDARSMAVRCALEGVALAGKIRGVVLENAVLEVGRRLARLAHRAAKPKPVLLPRGVEHTCVF